MSYAIVQLSLEPPSREQLERAFRALPELTDYDAAAMARDAFGILVDRLELSKAGRLLQALHAEGVEAEMVDRASLPQFPAPRPLRRADITPAAFVAYDHLGWGHEIEWPHVIFLAAGAVMLSEFKHEAIEHESYDYTGEGRAVPTVKVEHKDREVREHHLILEIFLDMAPGRYYVDAGRFNFAYLGDRLDPNRSRNFLALARDCLEYASNAVLNRGATGLRGEPPRLLEYPSKHAFEEESVWCLWRHFTMQRAGV